MVLLAGQYYVGTNIAKQNYKKAIKWYLKAAEKNDHNGLCYLGYCYLYGRDIEVDLENAYLCFSKSAYMGNANAMYKLGDMFYHGQFVNEDKDAAFYWYNRADFHIDYDEIYEKSSIDYRLGKCYLNGDGVFQDIKKGLEYLYEAEFGFLDAIEQGDKFSKLTLEKVKKEIEYGRELLYQNSTTDE